MIGTNDGHRFCLGSFGFVLACCVSGKSKLKQLSLWVLLMFSRWVRLAKMHFLNQFLSETSTASGGGTALQILFDAPAAHDRFLGQEAVLAGIHFGDGPVVGRFWPGGFLGVPAVGFQLRGRQGFFHTLQIIMPVMIVGGRPAVIPGWIPICSDLFRSPRATI